MSDDSEPPLLVVALRQLQQGIADLNEKLDAVRAGMATKDDLGAVRAGVMERIDRLQDTMNGLRDDIGVNFGNTDRVEGIASSASRETRDLAKVVRGMQRQIARIESEVRDLRDHR